MLLNLGGGRGRLTPTRRLDEVGVVVGEFERRRTLFGDVLERRERTADAEQQPGDPAAQPERLAHASGQLPLQLFIEVRQTLRDDFRPQGGRGVEVLGELLGSREAQQMRAVDVHHIERDRYAAGPPGLGDQLIWDEVRRYFSEDPRHLEREWPRASKLSGGGV